MSVIRVKHQENYVVLLKELLENPKITLKAKGLWAFCMAKPDKWEFHMTQLQDTLLEGRAALSGAIEELIEYGYCIRIQNKDGQGRWTTVDYEIYETSILKKSLPLSDFLQAESPLADNQQLLSNDPSKYTFKKKKLPLPPNSNEVYRTQTGEENMSKETIRIKMPSVKNEEFEMAWKEYEKAAIGSVKDVRRWLIAVVQRHRYETQSFVSKKNKVMIHKIQAQQEEISNPNRVVACNKHVEFVNGSHVKCVEYDVPDDEWEERTGWKTIPPANQRTYDAFEAFQPIKKNG